MNLSVLSSQSARLLLITYFSNPQTSINRTNSSEMMSERQKGIQRRVATAALQRPHLKMVHT